MIGALCILAAACCLFCFLSLAWAGQIGPVEEYDRQHRTIYALLTLAFLILLVTQ